MLPTSAGVEPATSWSPVNWLFGSGEVQNRFSRRRRSGHLECSDRNDFNYFCSTVLPDTSFQVTSQLDQKCMRCHLKQIVDAARRSTEMDSDRPQWLTMSIRQRTEQNLK